MKTLTPEELAPYLTTTYWKDDGSIPRQFFGGPIFTHTDIDGRQQAEIIRLALSAWSAVADIRFVDWPVKDSAGLILTDRDSGAYTETSMTGTGRTTSATVNVGWDWSLFYGPRFDSYYMQTWVHEIGHALGLGHPGLYNGDGLFGVDNRFANDSWQLSVMSYFSPQENPNVNASDAWAVTPMPADIIAIHQLYGTPLGAGRGNTTYGWNSNAEGIYKAVSDWIVAGRYSDPIMFTIFDRQGTNTIDLSGDRHDQVVRLGSHQYSDILGLRGIMAIAHDTVIHNYIGGHGNDHITGNAADNLLRGGAGKDTIIGLAGNDTIFGGPGHDSLQGGAGHDLLRGGAGRDTLLGGPGNDTLFGGVGRDELRGGAGHDLLRGGAGADTLWGGAGRDSLYGEGGADVLHGGPGADLLHGGPGHDTLNGGMGNDTLRGGAGNDVLNGGAGNDRLFGGAGDDRLIGGAGRDTMTGGRGSDTFVFLNASDSTLRAPDVITDFNPAEDVLDLSALQLTRVGSNGFTGAGRELWGQRDGRDMRLMADIDGDGRADFLVILHNLSALPDEALMLQSYS